jgi:aspartyl aminopeptidase
VSPSPPISAHDGSRVDLEHADDLLSYLAAAPSPYHAAAEAERRLAAAGFTSLDPAAAWPAGPGRYQVVRGGALVAWVVPSGAEASAGFRIVGAHTDSPNLRLKPRPDTGRAGWRQLGVEVYGGALHNSWLDRDLGLSGRVTVDGIDGPELRLVYTDAPLARVPQLAIHLDRGVNDGLKLNAQQHLVPLWSLGEPARGDDDPAGLRAFLAELLGDEPGDDDWGDPDDIVAWDLMFHDVQPPAIVGRDRDLVASGRIDNLLSCHAGVVALVEAADALRDAGDDDLDTPPVVPVLSLFDHEEIGSRTATGAQGAWLAQVLERITLGQGGGRDAFLRSLASSICVSADGAHATNPNYADRHEPDHQIRVDGGPVIKINANQRYATDAETSAWLLTVFARAAVPHQHFVSRADMPCGSTIGPLTAAGLAVATVDVGAPMLAMHSARELAGTLDAWRLTRVLAAAFTSV